MHKVLVIGAGKIGTLIACLLAKSGDYAVSLVDQTLHGADAKRLLNTKPNIQAARLDVSNPRALTEYLNKNPQQTVISCLPYFCNPLVAEIAKEFTLNYFDLTEDVTVTREITKLAKNAKAAFVPQCGLAPGFVSIVAHHLMQQFETLDKVQLRVGALPVDTNNALQYALTWSTDGLINEYGNACYGIEHGQSVALAPLEGIEKIEIDGLEYEAFHTSGGLGSLGESYRDKVKTMNYKTIRYPGHCDKMRFLMNDLKLNEDRATLKMILENALPKTYQDVVVIYISVIGNIQNELIEKNYVKKIYPQSIANLTWSAIQVTTAASLCAVVDIVQSNSKQYRGLILQEQFSFEQFLDNRFGCFFN